MSERLGIFVSIDAPSIIHNMEFTVEVGETEKQKIYFSFDKFWGKLTILVNDSKVIDDFRTVSLDLTKAYEFKVGTAEVHHIRIEKIRPLFFAGFRSNDYKVFVDGALFKEFKD